MAGETLGSGGVALAPHDLIFKAPQPERAVKMHLCQVGIAGAA